MRKPQQPPVALAQARAAGLRNIGEAAQASGVSAKMIRHYESIGLIQPANRTLSGYRLYGDADVHVLRFIKRARALGFAVSQIEALLRLWQDRSRASREVKRIALAQAAELDARIGEMAAMKRTLEHLAHHCSGDHRPECPILDDLAQLAAAPGAASRLPPGARNRSLPPAPQARPKRPAKKTA